MFGIYPVPPYTPLEAEGLICGGFFETGREGLSEQAVFLTRCTDMVKLARVAENIVVYQRGRYYAEGGRCGGISRFALDDLHLPKQPSVIGKVE